MSANPLISKKRGLQTVPVEKTQLEMFQEDLDNSILGQTFLTSEESETQESVESTVEETEVS